jgi:hypothetical protein
MKKENIDKIIRTIEDVMEAYPDVKEAKESDERLTWLEGGALIIQHGGKIVRFFGSIVEIGEEFIDIDTVESSELFDKICAYLGGAEEVKASVKKIIVGAVGIKEGIAELIAYKASLAK